MSKKNLLTGRDKELQELADRYESAKQEGKSIYMDAEDFADLADWYAMHHRYEEAKEVVDYGLGIHPDSTPLLLVEVNMLLELQQLNEAKQIVDKINEQTDEVIIVKADILYMEGHPRKAAALLDTLEDKDDLMNIIDVAYLYLDNGNPLKAEEWLMRGKGQYDDDEAYLAVLGDCYQALGKSQDGIKCFNKLIDRVPYSASFWYGLARCYYDAEMYDKLIEACDYATVIDEEYGDAYMLRATAYSHLGNEEKAMENYLLAEKYNVIPHSFIDGLRGINCTNNCKWEEGLKYLERALKTQEETAAYQFPKEDLYYNAAQCLMEMGKHAKAHQYCKKAQRLQPADPSFIILDGRVYLAEGNHAKAKELWQQAFDLAPYADTMFDIGLQSLEAGCYFAAKSCFENVRQLDPDFEGINENLASLCLMLGEMDDFKKYNRLSKYPLKAKDVKQMQELFDNANKGANLTEILAKLYKALDSNE